MTIEQLAAVAGVVLSLAFSYVPGLNAKFDAQPPTIKRLVMAALLLVVALGAFGLSCAQIISDVACTQAGAIGLVQVFIAALVANQGAFLLSPRPKS